MRTDTHKLALCAVLTALALTLSYMEGLLPTALVLPLPGFKLGLANIVTVFALYYLHRLPGLSIYGVSIAGAAAHNTGQVAAAVVTLGSFAPVAYLPVLLIVSLFTGALTGFVAALLFAALDKTSTGRDRYGSAADPR